MKRLLVLFLMTFPCHATVTLITSSTGTVNSSTLVWSYTPGADLPAGSGIIIGTLDGAVGGVTPVHITSVADTLAGSSYTLGTNTGGNNWDAVSAQAAWDCKLAAITAASGITVTVTLSATSSGVKSIVVWLVSGQANADHTSCVPGAGASSENHNVPMCGSPPCNGSPTLSSITTTTASALVASIVGTAGNTFGTPVDTGTPTAGACNSAVICNEYRTLSGSGTYTMAYNETATGITWYAVTVAMQSGATPKGYPMVIRYNHKHRRKYGTRSI